MSIQSEILRTEEIKNLLRLAKDDIDNVIIEKGGNASGTLTNIPKRIEDLCSKFTNVAVLDTSHSIKLEESGYSGWFRIPTNLSFIPKYAFIEFYQQDVSYPERSWWDTRKDYIRDQDRNGLYKLKLSDAKLYQAAIHFYKSTNYTTNYVVDKITLIG